MSCVFLLHARPGPPSVVTEEAVIVGRVKGEAHGAKDRQAPRESKEDNDLRARSVPGTPATLVDDREAAARPSEPRVHDVVEDRAEAVTQAEVEEIGVRCCELALAEEPILIT